MTASTIDPAEVAYYRRLAEQWWDERGPFWPLHRLNRLRVSYLREAICRHFGRDPSSSRPLEGLRILDIGCGGGILSESMARLGARVHGIDVVERNIHIARQHAFRSRLDIDYEEITVEQLAARRHSYDVVLNMEVVEHVANLPEFMAPCCELVADDGITFIATINRNPLAWLVAIIGAEYVLRWLPRGTHHWRKLVKPGELKALLSAGGLQVRDATGVRVNPFNRRFSLTESLRINYMLSATHAAS